MNPFNTNPILDPFGSPLGSNSGTIVPPKMMPTDLDKWSHDLQVSEDIRLQIFQHDLDRLQGLRAFVRGGHQKCEIDFENELQRLSTLAYLGGSDTESFNTSFHIKPISSNMTEWKRSIEKALEILQTASQVSMMPYHEHAKIVDDSSESLLQEAKEEYDGGIEVDIVDSIMKTDSAYIWNRTGLTMGPIPLPSQYQENSIGVADVSREKTHFTVYTTEH